MKNEKDWTYNELVEEATREIHSALLEGGGRNMRSTVHMWLNQAILWDKRMEGKEKKK
jgi:hypothetical protein